MHFSNNMLEENRIAYSINPTCAVLWTHSKYINIDHECRNKEILNSYKKKIVQGHNLWPQHNS